MVVQFSQITLPLVEPRSGTTLAHTEKHYHNWLSMIIDWKHGITYDPVFAISDHLSHCMGALLLIFFTSTIKIGL